MVDDDDDEEEEDAPAAADHEDDDDGDGLGLRFGCDMPIGSSLFCSSSSPKSVEKGSVFEGASSSG
jgi:hypothetical protein